MEVTIEQHPATGTVAVKRAAGAGDAERLRHEAAALGSLRHPGVVELVDLRETAAGPELVTALAGTATLAQAALAPREAAATVATLATTVADLHDAGWVHRRIEPSHVVLAADGRPVLCSFTGAAFGDGDGADDVAALGRLLEQALDGGSSADRRLHQIARHAVVPDAALRPSARALAASIQRALAPAQPRARRPRAERARRRPAPRTIGALTAAALAVAGAAWVTVRDAAPGVPIEIVAPGTTDAPPAPATRGAGHGAPVVTWRGARFEIGRPGDEVTTGDWDCDGEATPALVRPATGEVFVFTAWARDGDDVTVTPVTEIDGARSPRAADPDGDGCDELTVDRHGRRAVVWPA